MYLNLTEHIKKQLTMIIKILFEILVYLILIYNNSIIHSFSLTFPDAMTIGPFYKLLKHSFY